MDTSESPWDSEVWLSHIREYAAILHGDMQYKRTFFANLKRLIKIILFKNPDEPKNILTISRIIKHMSKYKKIKIVDVGGGFGDNYHHISLALGKKPLHNIEYHIVDNQKSIDLGRQFFSNETNKPLFHTSLPNDLSFDIVICIGTLHYVNNYADYLAMLCKICKDTVYISRSPFARHEKSFFTIQNICPVYGKHALCSAGKCPVSVINLNELTSIFELNCFNLAYKHHAEDYSANFSRLPERFNKADYFDLVFVRKRGWPH